MDKITALNYAKQYAEKINKLYSPVAIMIYGSYANGIPTENSDIDIAVIFDGFDGDYLETSANLYQMTCDICTAIEPIILDLSKDRSGFANEIMRTGYNVAW